MKTVLKINDNLKDYLYKEIDRTDTGENKNMCQYMGVDSFNYQWLFRFNNNYGASVIKHWGSYGFEEDLFELAVIYYDGDDFSLTYDTPITNDVIGHLTNDEVMEILEKIKELEV